MGSINIDNTGSGGAITLSSDGTSLLLGGSAVGGSPDLYAENYDGTSTLPSATGTNSVAIGIVAVASGSQAMAFGEGSTASGNDSLALSDATASANNTIAIGAGAAADSASGIAIGKAARSFSSGVALGKDAQTNGAAAVSLGSSYNSGAGSFAAVIDNNTSSYGTSGANSIAMGYRAKGSSGKSTAIGGEQPLASGSNSFAAGGEFQTASGAYSVSLGGSVNTASGEAAYAFGKRALADKVGKYAYGAQLTSTSGATQAGMMVLVADTTDATSEALRSNTNAAGTTNQIILLNNSAYAFHGTIVAREKASEGTECAAWKVEGLIRREGSAGTTVLVNSATTIIDNTYNWDMVLSADTTNGGLAITCTGAASTNIRWVATIHTSEVTYA